MPPLVTTGYGIAGGNLGFWWCSVPVSYQLGIHCTGESIRSCKLLKFPMAGMPRRQKNEEQCFAIAGVVGLLVLAPSIYLFLTAYTRAAV
jgi:flagellar biosynthesis protein FliP